MNRRTHLSPKQHFRSVQNENGGHTLSGYASLYNVLSNELAPGVREKIAPGAFDRALTNVDCTFNVNHSDDALLGRTSSGTLRLSSDNLGLRFEVDVPDTQTGRDIGILCERGDLHDCSFAFTVDPNNIDVERVNETEIVETIRSVEDLLDCSLVTRGAYPQPFAAFRNADTANEIERAVEKAFSKHNPQPLETRTGESGEANQESESHTANDFDFDIALAELDLQYHSTLISES